MQSNSFFDFIEVDEYSSTPKYLQLFNAVILAIEEGKLKKGSVLPSINEVSFNLEVSRDTAEKGYRYLRKSGVITSVPGKGYYIADRDFERKLKVFLLFNKLSVHKKIIYDSFIAALGMDVLVDFYIYNNDLTLFKKFLTTKKDDYSHYVVIPHFLGGEQYARDVINAIPKDKLVLLDKRIQGIEGEFAAVYQHFEQDIYQALEQAKEDLSRYDTLKIIFPKNSYFPKEILDGFLKFCHQYAFSHVVVEDILNEPITEGEVYINLMENDLVVLIERIIDTKYTLGKQVGIISYNETSLKKIILNGITTISTDFKFMGATAARLILENSKEHIEAPFYYTKRASL